MTKEREREEHETMEVVKSWAGEDNMCLRAAAVAYARGLRDGAQIMAISREESLPRVAAPHNLMY